MTSVPVLTAHIIRSLARENIDWIAKFRLELFTYTRKRLANMITGSPIARATGALSGLPASVA
jgi:hypothetical protein